jgi:hypothetical protein
MVARSPRSIRFASVRVVRRLTAPAFLLPIVICSALLDGNVARGVSRGGARGLQDEPSNALQLRCKAEAEHLVAFVQGDHPNCSREVRRYLKGQAACAGGAVHVIASMASNGTRPRLTTTWDVPEAARAHFSLYESDK